MVQQLLWVEIALKASAGVLLLVAPRLVARGVALPALASAFWPRLLGAVLIGLVAAIFLPAYFGRGNGLGIGGAAAINLSLVVFLVSYLAVGLEKLPLRGRLFLWLSAITFAVLSAVEIAYA